MPALPFVSPETARTLLLAGQGLLHDPRRRADASVVQELIEQLGFVQVDSINIVERAHHLTLASRLDGYRPPFLEQLLEQRRSLFEQWTHDASVIPTRWFEHWAPSYGQYVERVKSHPWWQARLGPRPDTVIAEVMERVAQEGPLLSRDFERPADAVRGVGQAWWNWRPHKAALEHLWRSGRLAVARRINFHKVYDLTERVFPEPASRPRPAPEAHRAWACRTAIERLGVATSGEIAAFWDLLDPAEAALAAEEAAARGEIVPVEVGALESSSVGARPRRAWAVPDWQERAEQAPAPPPRLRLLSPFDPILRDRRRSLRLFGFDYRFEAFVPAPQRRYGYYTLPLLEGDRLVGRVDPKFDRASGTLQIREVWWEPGVRPGTGRRAALEAAVARLARTIGAERFTVAE
jgi:uncharacterized protein YcaQ